jgi:hypothetical protein
VAFAASALRPSFARLASQSFAQRVDADDARPDRLGEHASVPLRGAGRDEGAPARRGASSPCQSHETGETELLALDLDADLTEAEVAREVGEGGVVGDERGAGELAAAVLRRDAMASMSRPSSTSLADEPPRSPGANTEIASASRSARAA